MSARREEEKAYFAGEPAVTRRITGPPLVLHKEIRVGLKSWLDLSQSLSDPARLINVTSSRRETRSVLRRTFGHSSYARDLFRAGHGDK